jgi:hypothetical protein
MMHFTQAQLDEMVETPAKRIDRALAGDDLDHLELQFSEMAFRFHEAVDLYGRWAAATIAFLVTEHGTGPAGRACDIENLLIGSDASGVVAPQLVLGSDAVKFRDTQKSPVFDEIKVLVREDRRDAARSRWLELIDSYRAVHDLRRDWVTQLLSEVYRTQGVSGLEQALRYAHRTAWIARPASLPSPPLHELLPVWAAKMSIGHYGTVHIKEDETSWVLTLDPCGSCGRQVRDGRYETFPGLEVVKEACPITFSTTGISVYQTHLAVIHSIIGIEVNGVPTPAIRCSGVASAACAIVLYKEPATTDREFFAAVGMEHARVGSDTRIGGGS